MMRTRIFASLLLLLTATPVLADCRIAGPYSFFVAQNDAVTYQPVMDVRGCLHNFTAGATVSYSHADIVEKPQHGSLRKVAALRFSYTPKTGYRGRDKYVIKICGSSSGGTGCSTLTFLARIE